MVSETRLVVLLPLETKLVALDNTVKLSCTFVQYYRNQRLFPSNWVKKILFGVHKGGRPLACTIVVICQYFLDLPSRGDLQVHVLLRTFLNFLDIFCGRFKRDKTFEIYSIETIGDVNKVNNVFLLRSLLGPIGTTYKKCIGFGSF